MDFAMTTWALRLSASGHATYRNLYARAIRRALRGLHHANTLLLTMRLVVAWQPFFADLPGTRRNQGDYD